MTETNNERETHDDEWQEARKRVTARREFGSHLVAYVVINSFLVFVWAVTGAGYFWPAWILAGWGIGIVLHAWDVFVRRPVTDADVEAELLRNKQRSEH
jgi:fatty acid desaturase